MGKKNLPPMGYFIAYRCIYFCYIRSLCSGILLFVSVSEENDPLLGTPE